MQETPSAFISGSSVVFLASKKRKRGGVVVVWLGVGAEPGTIHNLYRVTSSKFFFCFCIPVPERKKKNANKFRVGPAHAGRVM